MNPWWLGLLGATTIACARTRAESNPARDGGAARTVDASEVSVTAGAWKGKSLHVWLTSCDADGDEARALFAALDRRPGVVTSVGFACQKLARDGSFSSSERPAGSGRRRIAALLHARSVTTAIAIANYGVSGFDGALARAAIDDPTARAATIDALEKARVDEGHDAIELDLEGLPTAAKDSFSSFVGAVVTRSGEGHVVVDVHPKTVDDPGWDGPGADDYRALAATGAIVRVMTYDLSVGPVPPGPSTKARWIADVVAYARSRGVPASRLEIGLPAYGYDFALQNKGYPAPMKHREVLARLASEHAFVARDEGGAPHFSYVAEDGRHEVWFDDAESLTRVLDDARAIAPEVRGLGVWGIDGADPKLVDALGEAGL